MPRRTLHVFVPVWLVLAATRVDANVGTIPDLLGEFNCDKVVLHKTHRTGSTILAQILHRVGTARDRRFALPDETASLQRHYKTLLNERFELLQKHGAAVSPAGMDPPDFATIHKAVSLPEGRRQWLEHYGPQLGASGGAGPGFMSVVREPVSRFISHFYYYGWSPYATVSSSRGGRPHQTVDVNQRMLNYYPTSQAAELLGLPGTSEGAAHAQQLLQLQTEELLDGSLVLLTEQLLEGVAALYLHCGWPLRHVAFARVHCGDCWDTKLAASSAATAAAAQGRLGPAPPPIANHVVTAETQMEISRRTAPDGVVYGAAKARWDNVKQRAPVDIKQVAQELSRRNEAIDSYCQQRIRAPVDLEAFPGCLWVALYPVEFLRLVGQDGRIAPNRTFTPSGKHRGFPGGGRIQAWQMIQGYEAMCDELFPEDE